MNKDVPSLTWEGLLRGAMAFDAPFAQHPSDRMLAEHMLSEAAAHRKNRNDIEGELISHLKSTPTAPEFIQWQLSLLRDFLKSRLTKVKGGWVIYKACDPSMRPIAVLPSRLADMAALKLALKIYQARELSPVAQYMCIRKGQPNPVRHQFYRYSDNCEWAGEVTIGHDPAYVLRKAAWIKCPADLDPQKSLEWEAKPRPEHVVSASLSGLRLPS